MHPRKIKDGVFWVGAIDWDRRLFDALMALPDGTSYNAYLIQGSEKIALLDTVDPSKQNVLLSHLRDVPQIDYVISHHAEPDHSGAIPIILDKYPKAKVVTSTKAKGMLIDLLMIPEDKFILVNDGDTLSLGGKTLKFIYTPWVHWPETMVTYLPEERILFTCDWFGSHLATSDLFVTDEKRVYDGARKYYAEIMMPFRTTIQKNLEKIKDLAIDYIAPSHGPIYDKPGWIFGEYKFWISDTPRNVAIVAYVSTHGSTKMLAERLVGALTDNGVIVQQFDLSVTDAGSIAFALVDAATLVLGTPSILGGVHPAAYYAAYLANVLRPKLKFASAFGSFGWSGKPMEQIAALIPNLKVELLPLVLCKGHPRQADFEAIEKLADSIAQRHRENLLV